MTTTAWDEPAGVPPRGTLILLPGRGETPASYARFGKRLSADAYKVRLVAVDLEELADATDRIRQLVTDESLPSPKVLVGSDSGATLAALLACELPVNAVVLAGLALPGPAGVGSWEDEIAARTACPVHRRVIDQDLGFAPGALNAALPWTALDSRRRASRCWSCTAPPTPSRPAASALAPYSGAPSAWVRLVENGRHDVLNDAMHRSVAATIVLFLESLRLGPELPEIVTVSA